MKLKLATLGAIYEQCGHLYVTNQYYVHLHFYSGDKQIVDYLAMRLPVRVVPHRKIFDLVLSNRQDLAAACRQLLQYDFSPATKRELVLALSYANATDRLARHGKVLELKELLRARAQEQASSQPSDSTEEEPETPEPS